MARTDLDQLVGRAKRLLVPARDLAQRLHDRARGIERIHFLHIGKTGGTAVKEALQAASVPGKRILLGSHSVTLADVPPGEACFFFVREPVARFVSGFYSRQRQGRPRYNIPWSVGEEKAFGAFDTPGALALALSSADEGRREAAVQAMRSIGHVRDSYWKWLVSEDDLRRRRGDILFVGSQEHLGRDVGMLSQRLGVELALPSDEVSSHRMPGHLSRDLDPQAVRNLADWYRDDYRCLALLLEWFPHLPAYGVSRGDKRPLGG